MFGRASKRRNDEGLAVRSPPADPFTVMFDRFGPIAWAFAAETRIRSGANH